MLQILALILGLSSWGLLIYRIIANKKFDRAKVFKFQSISGVLCAVALYMPSAAQYMEFKADDTAAIIDCVPTYYLASFVLLLVTLILSIISVLMIKKEK